MSKELTQEDLNLLWSLMPNYVKELPNEDGPVGIFYGTLSRQGDIDIHNKVATLLNQKKDE